MTKDQKKKLKIAAVIAAIVVLIIWLARNRTTQTAQAADDAKDAADAFYSTYNMPALIPATPSASGGIDLGDVTTNAPTIYTTGGTSPDLDLDGLADKLCGCMNKCGNQQPAIDYTNMFAVSAYVPPPKIAAIAGLHPRPMEVWELNEIYGDAWKRGDVPIWTYAPPRYH